MERTSPLSPDLEVTEDFLAEGLDKEVQVLSSNAA
jgi:hypothetical protein